MPITASLKVVNVELNKDIRDVKCTGAEKNKNIVDEDAKNTLYRLAFVHDDRRKRGTTVRDRLIVSVVLLSPIFGAKKWALSACQAESQ